MGAVTRLLSEKTVGVKKKAGRINEKKGLWSLVWRVAMDEHVNTINLSLL